MKVCICGAGAIGDAKLASMRDLGPVMGAATPTIDMILALVQQRAKIAGLYSRAAPDSAESRRGSVAATPAAPETARH